MPWWCSTDPSPIKLLIYMAYRVSISNTPNHPPPCPMASRLRIRNTRIRDSVSATRLRLERRSSDARLAGLGGWARLAAVSPPGLAARLHKRLSAEARVPKSS